MTQATNAVTQTRPFCQPDGLALFSVNAGVPVSDALEQATIVLECIEHLVVSRAATDDELHATTLQYLTEMAKALVDATRPAE